MLVVSFDEQKQRTMQSHLSPAECEKLSHAYYMYVYYSKCSQSRSGCSQIKYSLKMVPSDHVTSLSLILRPTVSLPVYLRIKHPSGAYDQIFICL
jgi:hypothetical protein